MLANFVLPAGGLYTLHDVGLQDLGIRKMSERGPRWSWTLLVHQGGSWSPWSTWSTPIRSDPHFWKYYSKCGSAWIRLDQEYQGGHNPPWWTRSRLYILLMYSIHMVVIVVYEGWNIARQSLGFTKGCSYQSCIRARGARLASVRYTKSNNP